MAYLRVASILTCSICCRNEWASAFSSAVRSRTATATANEPRHRDRTSLNASNDEILRGLLGGGGDDDQDPYSTYTHQIAVPLGDATLLHESLRPIQTSLVRDCPRLIRACIMPALLRLPLLYVDGARLPGTSSDEVDTLIEKVVHESIQSVVYGGQEKNEPAEPVMLPFCGLELQGEDNSVLYAVGQNSNDETSKGKQTLDGDEDGVIIVDDWTTTSTGISEETPQQSGWETLEKLVDVIQDKLEKDHELKTSWPLDEPQGEELVYDDASVDDISAKQRKWRPRVPFVRLPKGFYQDLEADLKHRKENEQQQDGDEMQSMTDLGLDGISPWFWYEAWGEEEIVPLPGVRMRSIAVFKRLTPGGGEAEESFYVPNSVGPESWSLELPTGNSNVTEGEREEDEKAMRRMGDIERQAEKEWEDGKMQWMDETKTPSSGEHDASYEELDIGIEYGEVTVGGDAAYSNTLTGPNEQVTETETRSIAEQQDSSAQDDSVTSSLPEQPRRELPSIEDNPVFQRLWKGQKQVSEQGQNSALTLQGAPQPATEALPPYPCDAYFVGAWRVVASPLGSDESLALDSSSQSSDNFILRVDKQVMGGPLLDSENKQKAAGGEWKMFQAVRKFSESDAPVAPPVPQTRLRLSLLVPPSKERTLVMEGEVNKLDMPKESVNQWSRTSFDGILEDLSTNESDRNQSSGNDQQEGLLYCSGEAWMEDTDGGGNRRKLGPFSLMKLKQIDRSKLIYTVDSARLTQNENEDT